MEVISAENYVDGSGRLHILSTLFQERYGHRPEVVVRVPGDHLGEVAQITLSLIKLKKYFL